MATAREVVRAAVLAEARSWLGTPYRHQASRKGVGCDCLGLVRGVWRTLDGTEPEAPGPYAADWAETAQLTLGEPYATHGTTVTLVSVRPEKYAERKIPRNEYRFVFEGGR